MNISKAEDRFPNAETKYLMTNRMLYTAWICIFSQTVPIYILFLKCEIQSLPCIVLANNMKNGWLDSLNIPSFRIIPRKCDRKSRPEVRDANKVHCHGCLSFTTSDHLKVMTILKRFVVCSSDRPQNSCDCICDISKCYLMPEP